jgi:hypothetical protein
MSSTNQIFARNGYGINQLQVKADQHAEIPRRKRENYRRQSSAPASSIPHGKIHHTMREIQKMAVLFQLFATPTFGNLEDENFEGGRYIMYFKLFILSPPHRFPFSSLPTS